jgi:DNA polymerase-3 subunit epsilon
MMFRRRSEGLAAYRAAGRPAASAPWREAGWCAVDLELTGLDPRRDEIVALGAVPIEDGRVLLGEAVYTLARPGERPSHGAVVTHKLRFADLIDAPPVDEAVELLLRALAGRVPVFHTAVVERSFLGPLLLRRRVRLPAAADTEALGRLWVAKRGDADGDADGDGEEPSFMPLARLARELGQEAEPPHHALGDAVTTAQAFIALAAHLDRAEPQTVGSLVRASQPRRAAGSGARRFAPG